MTQHLYSTSLDGMKTIQTENAIEENMYVYIHDDLYKDDVTLFKSGKKQKKHFVPKNKNVDDELEELDLKPVKLAEIRFLEEEEMANFKFNQMYTFGNRIFTSTNRLNKNQMFQIDNSFYIVKEIIKHKDKPLELVLDSLEYVDAVNLYTIIKSDKESGISSVHTRYSKYRDAIISLGKLRESRDNSYYRFP